MQKRLVRLLILLLIAVAAALGIASAAGAVGRTDDATMSTESNSWGAGAFSLEFGAA